MKWLIDLWNWLDNIKIKYILFSFIMVNFIINPIAVYFSSYSWYSYAVPFYEECHKLIFLLINFYFGVTYILVFAINEYYDYINYMSLYIPHYMSVPSHYHLIRIIIIFLHLLWGLNTYIGVRIFLKTRKVRYIFLFLLVSVLFHLYWNMSLNVIVYNFVLKFY